jgi:DNA-binding transcriptional MerR regulator
MTIREMCDAYDVTPRTLRFYETKELLAPIRRGQKRLYTHRDRARLTLILRGKRFGFSLEEIRQLLDLYHADDGERAQLRAALSIGRKHLTAMKEQRAQLDAAIAEPAPEISAPVERNARVEDLDIVARYLARSGRPDEAWRMLVLEVESGPGTALAGSLTELTLRHADELRRQERFDDAEQRLLRVIRALAPEDPNQSLLERKLDQVRGGDLISRARRARAEGDLIEAYRLARAAGQTDTGSDARVLAGELRAKLIDSLHNDALVAWRDRDVDRAIRRWETLLESVPDFEPARIYLERARRLRKRLDQS